MGHGIAPTDLAGAFSTLIPYSDGLPDVRGRVRSWLIDLVATPCINRQPNDLAREIDRGGYICTAGGGHHRRPQDYARGQVVRPLTID
jgi:hypothetical protein